MHRSDEKRPSRIDGPHQGQPVRKAGASLERAEAALVMVHGRGATARSLLALTDEFAHPDVAYLAPQAAGRTWYPQSFLAPLAENEPGLSSGLQAIADVLEHVRASGMPAARTALLGFSQGACLALEYAARRAQPLGGVVALSGGLIGTGEREEASVPSDKRFDYESDLDGLPIFLGCSDRDPHIPLERVDDSAEALRRLGADVTKRIYEDMGHTVNEDEVEFVRSLLTQLTSSSSSSVQSTTP